MYKLRPLDDNPIEHTGLQYARRCSNAKDRLYFFVVCLLCVSPVLSPSVPL